MSTVSVRVFNQTTQKEITKESLAAASKYTGTAADVIGNQLRYNRKVTVGTSYSFKLSTDTSDFILMGYEAYNLKTKETTVYQSLSLVVYSQGDGFRRIKANFVKSGFRYGDILVRRNIPLEVDGSRAPWDTDLPVLPLAPSYRRITVEHR